MPPPNHLAQWLTAPILRRLTLCGYFAVFVLVVLRYCWLAPPPHMSPWLPLVLTLAPLMLPLQGLLTGRRYTYKWSGFMALAYFAYAVDSLFIAGWSAILGVFEVAATSTWFVSGMFYVRRTRTQYAD